MRTNLPVTDVATPIPPGVSIVSKTDLAGNITYANDAFVEISGYSRHELIGQPHNLLRHPDMPPQAFAHLWKTLQAGNPWKGIVKNRRKDGGFYWVKAVVVPVRKDNQTIGYMSVRETAGEAEIHAAEALYRQLKASGAEIGEKALRNLVSIKSGYILATLFFIMLLLSGGLLGIGGLALSNASVEKLYKGSMQPLTQTAQLDAEAQDLRIRLLDADALANPAATAATAAALEQSGRRMAALLAGLRASPLQQAEADALAMLEQRYQGVAADAVAPLRAALAAGDAAAFRLALPQAQASLQALHVAAQAFNDMTQAVSQDEYQRIIDRNVLFGRIALAGLLFGIVIVLVAGRKFRKKIVAPLDVAIGSFDRIAQGDLSGDVELDGKGETGQLIRASAVMQMHLKVITDEIYLVAKEVRQYCATLNGALFEIADHSEIQHDRLSETRNELSSSQAFARDLKEKIVQLRALSAGFESPAADAQADFAALIDQVDNAIALQSFAIDDFLARIEQISELVVENRQDTQGAYAMSEHLQREADRLYELVNYFSQDEKKPGQR